MSRFSAITNTSGHKVNTSFKIKVCGERNSPTEVTCHLQNKIQLHLHSWFSPDPLWRMCFYLTLAASPQEKKNTDKNICRYFAEVQILQKYSKKVTDRLHFEEFSRLFHIRVLQTTASCRGACKRPDQRRNHFLWHVARRGLDSLRLSLCLLLLFFSFLFPTFITSSNLHLSLNFHTSGHISQEASTHCPFNTTAVQRSGVCDPLNCRKD